MDFKLQNQEDLEFAGNEVHEAKLDKILQIEMKSIGSHSRIYQEQMKVNELKQINQKLIKKNDDLKTEYGEIVSRREEMTRQAQSCFQDNISVLNSVFPKYRQNVSIAATEQVHVQMVPPKIQVPQQIEWTAAKQDLPSYQSSGAAKHRIQSSYQEFVVPKFSPSNLQHVPGKSEVPFVNFAVTEIQEASEIPENPVLQAAPIIFPIFSETNGQSVKQMVSPISQAGPFVIPESARQKEASGFNTDRFSKIHTYNIPSSRDTFNHGLGITPREEQATPVLPTEEDLLEKMQPAQKFERVLPFSTVDPAQKQAYYIQTKEADQSYEFHTPIEIRDRIDSEYLLALPKNEPSPTKIVTTPNFEPGLNPTFASNPIPYKQIEQIQLNFGQDHQRKVKSNQMPPIENGDPQTKVKDYITPQSDKQQYQISSISPIQDQPEGPSTPILIPTENSPTTKWTPYQPSNLSVNTNDRSNQGFKMFKSPVKMDVVPKMPNDKMNSDIAKWRLL